MWGWVLRVGIMVALVTAMFSPGLRAQFTGGSSGGPSMADMQAWVTSQGYATTAALNGVQGQIPVKSSSIPTPPTGSGTSGVLNTYVAGDAAEKVWFQGTTVPTDASGNWTVTWNTSFVSSTPVISARAVVASGNQPISCETALRSATGASGWCRQAAPVSISLALLPLSANIFAGAPPTNTPVMLFAREPTQ